MKFRMPLRERLCAFFEVSWMPIILLAIGLMHFMPGFYPFSLDGMKPLLTLISFSLLPPVFLFLSNGDDA